MPRASSRVVNCKDRFAVKEATEVLLRGGFVVAPSDTIYGIYSDATNYDAVERLKKLRRPSGRPFIVLVPDISWVKKLGLELRAEKLLLVPGLTLVLRKRTRLYHWLGRETVAVRYPRRGFVQKLLKKLNRPIVAPSANREGEPPARSVEEAYGYFRDEVGLYVDCGRIEGSPSAVIDLSGKVPRVLRRGAFSSWSLKRVLWMLNS